MTVVVTGAAGHVGGNLVRALLAEGRTVRAVVRSDERALEGLPVARVRADMLDPAAVREAVDGAEVVFHLAARISIMGDPDGRVHRTNVEGPRNVVAACLDAKVRRLVHFSSIHAYDHFPLDAVITEEHPRIGAHGLAYDRSKAAGEQQVLDGVARGLDAVIVSPAAVIGVHDYKPSRMGEVFLALYHRRLPALVPGGFDWVDVRDVVQGALAAEQKGRTGEKYNLFGRWASVRELAELTAEVTGVAAPRFDTPLWAAYLGAPFAELWCRMTGATPLYTRESLRALGYYRHTTHEKAARELGFSARPLRETVADTFEWFRGMGWLEPGFQLGKRAA